MRQMQEVESARGKLELFNMNKYTLENNISSKQDKLLDNKLENNLENKLENKLENTLENTVGKERFYDNTVDFRYICIKKEHFDVCMIYLKYMNLKKANYIEIIYKSPSIFLDGLFFKTPPLNASQLSIFTKDRMPYTSVITAVLDRNANSEFINMLKSIDTYLSNYIIRHARDINTKMNQDENHYLNYENILKPYYNSNKKANTNARENLLPYATMVSGNKTSSKWTGNYMISFKSYLERSVLDNLKQSILDSNTEKKIVITFNISNIYFSQSALTPLIKCNKCEVSS